MLIEFDLPEEYVEKFLEYAYLNDIEIQKINYDGPGGGNTQIVVVVDTRKGFDSLGTFYFGDSN